MLILFLAANFFFVFFACLSAVPDFVAFDTGLLSACWAGHERFCFWVAPTSTAAVWVSTLSVVIAVFHIHSPLEDARIVAFEVCGGRHVLQVVVVEDAMTCLHRTADAVPADSVDLHVDVMLDAGLADGGLSWVCTILRDCLSQFKLWRDIISTYFAFFCILVLDIGWCLYIRRPRCALIDI